MIVAPKNPVIRWMMGIVQHYNAERYWRYREEVVNPLSSKPKLIRLYYLYYIKRCDAFNCASFGTDLGQGAVFRTPPRLPHHLNGIIIAHNAKIGSNCTIYQRVTITQGDMDNGAIIGDNCMLGSNSVVLGGVHIGDNVSIGANAVVTHDIPSDCTAVGVPAKVVKTLKKTDITI